MSILATVLLKDLRHALTFFRPMRPRKVNLPKGTGCLTLHAQGHSLTIKASDGRIRASYTLPIVGQGAIGDQPLYVMPFTLSVDKLPPDQEGARVGIHMDDSQDHITLVSIGWIARIPVLPILVQPDNENSGMASSYVLDKWSMLLAQKHLIPLLGRNDPTRNGYLYYRIGDTDAFYATNSYIVSRLALGPTLPGEASREFMIPALAWSLLYASLDASQSESSYHCKITRAGNVHLAYNKVMSVRWEGAPEPPNYEKVFPSQKPCVQVLTNKDDLSQAIKHQVRPSLMASAILRPIDSAILTIGSMDDDTQYLSTIGVDIQGPTDWSVETNMRNLSQIAATMAKGPAYMNTYPATPGTARSPLTMRSFPWSGTVLTQAFGQKDLRLADMSAMTQMYQLARGES